MKAKVGLTTCEYKVHYTVGTYTSTWYENSCKYSSRRKGKGGRDTEKRRKEKVKKDKGSGKRGKHMGKKGVRGLEKAKAEKRRLK